MVRFEGKSQSGFYQELKSEVDNYFKSKNISKHANIHMALKSAFFLGSMALLYYLVVFSALPLGAKVALVAILGMVKSFIGFNVSHDAIHRSYSSSNRVNRLLAASFHFIGANPYIWETMHNKVHHTFTNIPGHDADLDIAPGLVRISPDEEKKSYMKYQHIYCFFVYGLASLSWVFRKDFVKFFDKEIGKTESTNHPPIEWFKLFFFKGVYYILFIVIPLIFMDITWLQFIAGFFIMHFAMGLTLGLVFQLAHVVEGPQFPVPNENDAIEENWAVHQMNTTANFAINNKLVSFLCGGLNFQIEHHLFAQVCHIHYPALSKIVKTTAEKYGVPYYSHPTFFEAMQSHSRVLKALGT